MSNSKAKPTANDLELMKIVRAEKAQYAREWRNKNPGKAAEYNRRYWERKALARLEQEKEDE